MGIEMEKAKQTLFGVGGMECSNIKIFPGTSREVTAEQIAEQINLSLQEIMDGKAELIEYFDD